jgi:hypothetical protein
MKKSEMILAIADVLYQKNPWYASARGKRLLHEHCQAVLERIEELGMLPPLQDNYTLEDSKVVEPYNWEPENEQS